MHRALTEVGAIGYHAALMSASPSTEIDPWQAVAREATYAGSFSLQSLPRLCELLAKDVSAAEGGALGDVAVATYDLAFRRDKARRPVVLGWVRAVVPLVCQRCLGVVEHPVDSQVCLLLLPGADVGVAPEPYDPYPVVSDRVSLADLVEDELLLALPQIPMHSPRTCRVVAESPGSDGGAVLEVSSEAQRRPNPFAALADWKLKSKN
jgi:uncharacterized protein